MLKEKDKINNRLPENGSNKISPQVLRDIAAIVQPTYKQQ